MWIINSRGLQVVRLIIVFPTFEVVIFLGTDIVLDGQSIAMTWVPEWTQATGSTGVLAKSNSRALTSVSFFHVAQLSLFFPSLSTV